MTTYTHQINIYEGQEAKPRTLHEFNARFSFGKTALYMFRSFVRLNFPDAKIVLHDGTITSFHFTVNDGDTIELR